MIRIGPVSDIIKLTAALATRGAVQHARQSFLQGTRAVAVNALAAGCVLTGFACVLAALWIYAVPHVGPVGAPLIVAGVLFVVAGGMILIYRNGATPRQSPPPLDISAALLTTEAANFVKNHSGSLLLAALIAGAATARKEP